MGLQQTTLTGLLLLLPVIYASSTTERSNATQTQLCPYTENPFYLDTFEVPEEKDSNGFPVKTKQVLVLHWIEKEHVGCELVHNDGLKSSLRLSCSPYRCNISDDCYKYLETRISHIQKAVTHNLIVVLKVKALEMFGGTPFKQVIFTDKVITDMPDEDFYDLLLSTMQMLYTGITVPNKMQKVSYEDYEDMFREGIELHGKLEGNYFFSTKMPGSSTNPKCTKEGNEKCNDANLERLYRVIAGDQDDVSPSGHVNFGYSDLRRLLEQGVRYIMKSLGKKDEDIKNLMLPMIPPCFQHTG